MQKAQLTLDFEKGLAASFGSCRELIAHRTHHQGRQQKSIAADMDYAPSDWTRKCAQAPDDSRRMTLDDAEKFIQITGDKSPIYYLIEKYIASDSPEEIQKQIDDLQRRLQDKGLKIAS